MNPEKTTHNNRFAIIIIGLFLMLFVVMVRDLIKPLAMAGLFAILLYPIYEAVTKRIRRLPSVSAMLILLLTILLILVPCVFLVFVGLQTLKDFAQSGIGGVEGYVEKWVVDLLFRSERYSQAMGVHLDHANLQQYAVGILQKTGNTVATTAASYLAAAPSWIIAIFIFLLALFFFLRDGLLLTRWMVRMMPFEAAETERLFRSVQSAIRGVVLGTILTAIAQSSLVLLGLLMFSIPNAWLWGAVSFLFAFVPLIGTTPVSIGCVFYLLMQGRSWAAVGMIVIIMIAGLVDNIIRPWMQKVHGCMHPLLGLISTFGGVYMLGAVGIFLGPIVAAITLWTMEAVASRS